MIIKKVDIVFAFTTGLFVAWIATDFLGKNYALFFYMFLPVFSVFCLFLAYFIGKKFNFVWQAAKFVLVGGFADIIDIKAFQLLFWLIPADLFVKSISFLIAVAIKYIGNKHWVFKIHEKGDANYCHIIKFFFITLIGLAINVVSFYLFVRIETGMPVEIWTELSIIFAAIAASVWNFVGYKFLVFKK